MPAGYSSTPLAKKLGIKEGSVSRIVNEPPNYFQLFADWPVAVKPVKDIAVKKDFIHFFTADAKELYKELPLLKTEIKQGGMIWVSWPKKAAKMKTDITEDVIRDFALQIGLVDIKVCAVDEIWSGLKLVIPVAKRVKEKD
jgi:hypothetical protein